MMGETGSANVAYVVLFEEFFHFFTGEDRSIVTDNALGYSMSGKYFHNLSMVLAGVALFTISTSSQLDVASTNIKNIFP